MRRIAVLGATGSIGRQALEIIRRYPDRFSAICLTARGASEKLFELAREFKPKFAALDFAPAHIPEDLRNIEWIFGERSSARAIELSKPDDALIAITGVAGLAATWAAIDNCERVLLANKESLVTGGEIVMKKARALNVPILPVDSEHSAIYQCLRARDGNPVKRLILTASGGALRDWRLEDLPRAKAADVLKHPTWLMGAKITVDCATMLNKGFEAIEARHLFQTGDVSVIIHPQSVVHSMVEFEDGAILAQMGAPDMRGPIGYALGFPERLKYAEESLDLAKIGALTFAEVDCARYPCFRLALSALDAGQCACVALNAASEIAVARFLSGGIKYSGIADAVENVLARMPMISIVDINDVYAADALARDIAVSAIGG